MCAQINVRIGYENFSGRGVTALSRFVFEKSAEFCKIFADYAENENSCWIRWIKTFQLISADFCIWFGTFIKSFLHQWKFQIQRIQRASYIISTLLLQNFSSFSEPFLNISLRIGLIQSHPECCWKVRNLFKKKSEMWKIYERWVLRNAEIMKGKP